MFGKVQKLTFVASNLKAMSRRHPSIASAPDSSSRRSRRRPRPGEDEEAGDLVAVVARTPTRSPRSRRVRVASPEPRSTEQARNEEQPEDVRSEHEDDEKVGPDDVRLGHPDNASGPSQDADLTSEGRGDEGEAIPQRTLSGFLSFQSDHIDIHVPACDTDAYKGVQLSSDSGDICVDDIRLMPKAEQQLEEDEAMDEALEQLRGEVHLASKTGTIRLHRLADADHVDIKTMSGGVLLHLTEAISLKACTQSGDVTGMLAVLPSAVSVGDKDDEVAISITTKSGDVHLKDIQLIGDTPGIFCRNRE